MSVESRFCVNHARDVDGDTERTSLQKIYLHIEVGDWTERQTKEGEGFRKKQVDVRHGVWAQAAHTRWRRFAFDSWTIRIHWRRRR